MNNTFLIQNLMVAIKEPSIKKLRIKTNPDLLKFLNNGKEINKKTNS